MSRKHNNHTGASHAATEEFQDAVEKISDDTQALLAATADIAEEKVVEARKRLASTISSVKETCATIQERAMEGAEAADKAIRHNPYQAMGVAFGVGALIGYLLCRRK